MKLRIAFVGAVLLGLPASLAIAAHPVPHKAKLLDVDMVTAFDKCVVPNTVNNFSLAGACSPPVATSSSNATNVVTFGPKGMASAQVKLIPGDVKIRVKGSDIRNNGLPFTGNLTLLATFQLTDHNCPLSPCTSTVTTLPIAIPCSSGKCALHTTANTVVPGLAGSGLDANIEIDQLEIGDPDGDVAFRQGLLNP